MERITPRRAPSDRAASVEPFTVSLSWWAVVIALLLVFSMGTRLWDLGTRSYSHDESIHAWESWKLATGQGYFHGPAYHGPFLYHITALVMALFGDNDVTARLAPALFGIGLVAMPLALKRHLGIRGVVASMLLLAVSPVMMHRSRYIRHDPFVLVFNLWLLIAMLNVLQGREKSLYGVAAALSLGYCTKETAFITHFAFFTYAAALALDELRRRGLQAWRNSSAVDLLFVIGTLTLPLATPLAMAPFGLDAMDESQRGVMVTGAATLIMLAISAGIGLFWDRRRWPICAAIYWGIFVALFTTLFWNGSGLATGIVGQLGYWLQQQGVKRGGQPAHYYVVILGLYEYLAAATASATLIYLLIHRLGRRPSPDRETHAPGAVRIETLLAYWTVAAFLLYSWAGEKMPWLTMHLALPLQLLAGWGLGRLMEGDWGRIRERGGFWVLLLVPLLGVLLVRVVTGTAVQDLPGAGAAAWLLRGVAAIAAMGALWWLWGTLERLGRRDAWRMVSLAAAAIGLLLTVRTAWMAAFINDDSATEFLVYAQGAPDAGQVAREIEALSLEHTGGAHLAVAYDKESQWPYAWYLRNYENAELVGEVPEGPVDAAVVLMDADRQDAFAPFLISQYRVREFRAIWWPYQDWYMEMTWASLWEQLSSPEERAELIDVIARRQYTVSPEDWPYATKLALYVREDLADGYARTVPGDDQ